MTTNLLAQLLIPILALSACGGPSKNTDPVAVVATTTTTTTTVVITANPVTPPPFAGTLSMLHTSGTKWVSADGKQVNLKGVNLGNWLVQESWMMNQGSNGINAQCKLEAKLDERFGYAERDRLMTLFHDNWITSRDWDMMAKFGLNTVRIPFLYSVVEDEKNPRHLRADAWKYFDDAITQAGKRGMYVILDLHGAVGGQAAADQQHDGCVGPAEMWTNQDYQDRTTWLWEQIGARYKDNPVVAGYSLLNEPWGTTASNLAIVVQKLYTSVRAVDPNHVIILPGHNSGINAYGNPADKGMSNVAFEMHFYPGLFGWGQIGIDVHRDWLLCTGGTTSGVCEWSTRLAGLNTAFFVGEFQPWTGMGAELGGQVTRASYDTYAKYGWASTSWAYKLVSANGGQGNGTWGLVTNASGASIPAIDFANAPMADIENLFKLFGSVPYEPEQRVMDWMTSTVAPAPFGSTAAK